jgi:hypothetical protein
MSTAAVAAPKGAVEKRGSGSSSTTKTEKPYQRQIQLLSAHQKYSKALEDAPKVYSEWLRYVLTEVDTCVFAPPSKKSKTRFPHKYIKVNSPANSSKNSGGETGEENAESSGQNAEGASGPTTIRRAQHQANTVNAPFGICVQNALKESHKRLKKNKNKTGFGLDRLSQGFLQRVCLNCLQYTNKSFKLDERAVLNAVDATIKELENSREADAHYFAMRLRDALQHIHETLDQVNKDQQEERERKRNSSGDDKDTKGMPHSYVALRLQEMYRAHMSLQPHGFHQYLASIFPQSITSIQKPAIILLDVLTSAFIYHVSAVFGSIYSGEEGSRQKKWASCMGHSYFLANEQLRKATGRVKVFPEDEYQAMRAIPLFRTMHDVWGIPQGPLPVSSRDRKPALKRKQRTGSDDDEEERQENAESHVAQRSAKRAATSR